MPTTVCFSRLICYRGCQKVSVHTFFELQGVKRIRLIWYLEGGFVWYVKYLMPNFRRTSPHIVILHHFLHNRFSLCPLPNASVKYNGHQTETETLMLIPQLFSISWWSEFVLKYLFICWKRSQTLPIFISGERNNERSRSLWHRTISNKHIFFWLWNQHIKVSVSFRWPL